MMFASDKTLQTWRPSMSLLRSGKTLFKGAPVTWCFTDLRIPATPMAFVECRLKYLDFEVIGLGDAFTFKGAAVKALAEAWERAWMRKLFGDGRVDIKSSNGFAAGRTSVDALVSAQDECVERAVFLAAWQLRRGWVEVDSTNIFSKLFISFLSNRGWTTNFYKIEGGECGQILAGLCRHSEFGAVFDTKIAWLGTKIMPSNALVRSLQRMIAVQEKMQCEIGFNLPEVATPLEHMRFYRDPINLRAFEFLTTKNASKRLDVDFARRDQKVELLCEVTNLPAVAYSYNVNWTTLLWGRQSIKGENSWPHPLV